MFVPLCTNGREVAQTRTNLISYLVKEGMIFIGMQEPTMIPLEGITQKHRRGHEDP